MRANNDSASYRAQVKQELYRLSERAHLLAQFPSRSEFEAQEVWYLNAATWIPDWRESRPDLNGHIVSTCVRFLFSRGAYPHKTLAWALRAQLGAPSFILEKETI